MDEIKVFEALIIYHQVKYEETFDESYIQKLYSGTGKINLNGKKYSIFL